MSLGRGKNVSRGWRQILVWARSQSPLLSYVAVAGGVYFGVRDEPLTRVYIALRDHSLFTGPGGVWAEILRSGGTYFWQVVEGVPIFGTKNWKNPAKPISILWSFWWLNERSTPSIKRDIARQILRKLNILRSNLWNFTAVSIYNNLYMIIIDWYSCFRSTQVQAICDWSVYESA